MVVSKVEPRSKLRGIYPEEIKTEEISIPTGWRL